MTDWVPVLILALIVVCATAYLLLDPKSRQRKRRRPLGPVLSPADKRHHIGLVGCSGDLPPPSPPVEKATDFRMKIALNYPWR